MPQPRCGGGYAPPSADLTRVTKIVTSPVGPLRLVAAPGKLTALVWAGEDGRRVKLGPLVENAGDAILVETERQLAAYFDGRLGCFTVPLALEGTAFQQDVWRALLAIPYGETRSYFAIAQALGRPNASRAVGAANGRNPIAIIVPCHRLVGTSGALTGFAGGLDAKRLLVDLEAGRRPALADGALRPI